MGFYFTALYLYVLSCQLMPVELMLNKIALRVVVLTALCHPDIVATACGSLGPVSVPYSFCPVVLYWLTYHVVIGGLAVFYQTMS